MYLAKDERPGLTNLVFTWKDPREDGYRGSFLEENVSLDYDMGAVHSWPEGQARPEPSVGRAPDNPKHYRVFKADAERVSAGYEHIAGTPLVFGTWYDYLDIRYPERLS